MSVERSALGVTANQGVTPNTQHPTPDCRPAGGHIRSYVLRQGRVSAAQQRAHETLLPRYGIAFRASLLDLDREFGRAAPKILEIGFGMGETTAAIAAAHPETDYLGIEVHTPGVGGLLKLIDTNRLANVRIIQHDAVEVLQHMIAPRSLDGVHIFFPDPWPKKRHHKRRLIQPPLTAMLAQKLKAGGYLHAATDWHEYAEQILAVCHATPDLKNTAPGYAPRPGYRPHTKFEARGLRLGHGVWDIVFRCLRIEDCGLQIADCGLRIADCGLRIEQDWALGLLNPQS